MFKNLLITYINICCSLSVDLFQQSLKSDEYGKHLLGVQDLLQKHTILESDINTLIDRAISLNKQVLHGLIEV